MTAFGPLKNVLRRGTSKGEKESRELPKLTTELRGREGLERGLRVPGGWLLPRPWPRCASVRPPRFPSSSKTQANIPLARQEANLRFNCLCD